MFLLIARKGDEALLILPKFLEVLSNMKAPFIGSLETEPLCSVLLGMKRNKHIQRLNVAICA